MKLDSQNKITSSGLTEFEVTGLSTPFNFADGHAYHEMPNSLQPVMNRIKVIWKESVSKRVPELEERFKKGTIPQSV
ncbi:MAG: hypothetical protein NTX03_03670 [Bacteroidetes bacterium]|nr:hypothetical protein [Bacteroidota bacterium]